MPQGQRWQATPRSNSDAATRVARKAETYERQNGIKDRQHYLRGPGLCGSNPLADRSFQIAKEGGPMPGPGVNLAGVELPQWAADPSADS
jgi:hypothetical protein